MNVPQLIQSQGWKIIPKEEKNGKISYSVQTPYEDDIGLLKLRHPAFLHLEIYAKHNLPEVKFQHMKLAHDLFWPLELWHEWTERRFKGHCGCGSEVGYYNFISQAGGASKAKSYDWAKIAVLFFFANPLERNVTVASTTLASLKGRVWGYLTRFVQTMAIQPEYNYKSSPNPQILPVVPEHLLKAKGRGKITDNTLHGMFAVTAKLGDDDQAVATWIGKHPDDKLLVILDEGTDMPMSIINTFPNLNSHPKKFQLCIIGNSKSTQDMHGCLSTPRNGWDSISVDLDEWRTVQLNGICQYFNPYRCPAIMHPDPLMRERLSEFLVSYDSLKAKELEYGTDSENFYRMVLGFWKSRSSEMTTVSEKFLKERSPTKSIQWSGYYPIQRVAGFDFAISQDGDNPMIRIANVGHDQDSGMKIDFGYASSLFKLNILAMSHESLEAQLARQVVDVLILYKIPLHFLAIDVTGQGRAIGEVIVRENEKRGFPLGRGVPMKIYSMSQHNKTKRKESAWDLIPMSTQELWDDMRTYIDKDSVRGLDPITIYQMTNRQIVKKGDKSFLESKKDYKRRMSALGNAHSPDEADATALCVQVVKQRLNIMPGDKKPIPRYDMAQSHFDKIHAMTMEQGRVSEKKVIQLPKVNFNAGLEAFARNKKSGF